MIRPLVSTLLLILVIVAYGQEEARKTLEAYAVVCFEKISSLEEKLSGADY